MIASKLARDGDMTYWRWVRKEAEKAVRHGQEQPRNRIFMHFGQRKPYDPNDLAANGVSPEPSPFQARIDVNAEKAPPENQLDIWRMFAFASGAPSSEKRTLRKALNSRQGLVSATAALGLARMHDINSIADIKAAAERHRAERPIFVEALIYLNDDRGTRIATDLCDRDESTIKSLQSEAKANHFDPFYTADEPW